MNDTEDVQRLSLTKPKSDLERYGSVARRKPYTRAASTRSDAVDQRTRAVVGIPTDLDMDIEHDTRVDHQAQRHLRVMRESLLIPSLNGRPLCTELLVLCVRKESFESREILEPNGLVNLESFGDEVREFRIALNYRRSARSKKEYRESSLDRASDAG